MQQNENYVGETTLQVGYRIDDVVVEAKENIQTIAYLCGEMLESGEMTQQLLKEIEDHSTFDYLEFTDMQGRTLTEEGEMTDASHRESYLKGIKGNAGICVIGYFRGVDEDMARDIRTPMNTIYVQSSSVPA